MGFEIKDNVLIKYTEETGVTEVTIPDGIISIGDKAFLNCKNITDVIMPDSITKIGYMAFGCCTIAIHKNKTAVDSNGII